MYEHITFETLLAGLLDRASEASPDIDTREGSVLYSALAPAAAELQNMYIEMDYIISESFADTQSRPFLARRAAERGVFAKDGTKAQCVGSFNIDVPIGARFYAGELFYKVLSRLSLGKFVLECEKAGVCGNLASGTLVPCDYIPGLYSSQLTGIVSHGSDPESVEQLRSRYFKSLEAVAFGGNCADYIQKAGALAGVGGVKVTPAWNGGGTVLLTITDSASNCPAQTLVDEVQAVIDPKSGSGAGIAPIGHYVTVRGATETAVNITAVFSFYAGYDWSQIKPFAEEAARAYIQELRERWADEEVTVVRISGLEQRMLAIAGVLDITDTALNGVKKNLTLAATSLPKLGSVSNG